MRVVSISRAWDECRAILARESQLYISISLALVAFPTLVSTLLNPKGMSAAEPFWISLVGLIASLVVLAGQLALMRLAMGPSITVGGAIGHGMRRMPIYLLSALMLVLALFVLLMPFAAVLSAMGVPIQGGRLPATPPVVIGLILYTLIAIFLGVRMSMGGPAATAEPIGPIAIIRRSWQLTAGHFWRLLGFLATFIVAASFVLIAVGNALGVVVALAFGPSEPLSLSALIIGLIHALLNAALTAVLAIMLARIYVQLTGDESVSGVPITGI
jgi:hypothetical protein